MPTASAGQLPEPVLPDEVVTAAHLRLLDVPGVAGQVALITLDNGKDHTRPSTFGPQGLRSLDAALDAAFAAEPAAIAVTGKPFVFAVGADLSGIGALADKADRSGLRRVGAQGVPPASRVIDPDLRLRQRGRARRRGRARAALPLPDAGRQRGHDGAARVFPRHSARLGRHPIAAEDRRAGERGDGDRRERVEPEPDAAAGAGGRTRRRRRRARLGRLSRAVAGLAGRRARRHHHRGPAGVLRGRLRPPPSSAAE